MYISWGLKGGELAVRLYKVPLSPLFQQEASRKERGMEPLRYHCVTLKDVWNWTNPFLGIGTFRVLHHPYKSEVSSEKN